MEIPDPSAPSEEDTEYDGFLSYAAEWHALTIGMGVGLTAALLFALGFVDLAVLITTAIVFTALGMELEDYVLTKKLDLDRKVVRDVSKEPWYAIGGVIIGWIGGVLISLFL